MKKQVNHKKAVDQEMPEQYTRWAPFMGAVLWKDKSPMECLKVIVKRQTEVDDETNEADLVAAYFRERLRQAGQDPIKCCIYLTSAEVAEWLATATGAKIPANRATPYLRTLSIAELRYTHKNGVPGWVWRGRRAGKKQKSLVFSKLKYVP